MALSRIVVFGDGSNRQWAIPFALGYIKQEDVTCRVGVEVDGTGEPVYRPLTFLSPEWVEVGGAAPGNGVRVEFTRTVVREELIVNYSDGDVMNEINLDTAQRQAIMLVHEVLDGRFEAFQSDFNLGGFQVKNLGDPTEDTDAANKRYVDARITTGAANAAAAAASASAAEGSASSAAGSASNAATSATSADTARAAAVASASAAAGSAGSANTSATNAATSATEALGYRNTASTHATNAGTSASAAAGSATAAGTSATNAANSATVSGTARDQSVAAKDLAVTANTNAQSAKTASETARDQSVTARNAAQASAAAAALSEGAVATASVLAGTIVMRFGPLLPGYIAWGEGGTFDRATYPALAAWLDTNGASLGLTAPQIAAGTIPDWRDYSPRTAGGALGPAVGAKQEDAFQSHQHAETVLLSNEFGPSLTGYNNAGAVLPGGSLTTARDRTSVPVSDGVNGTPRTAIETRVKSFGIRWQIKAFGATVDQGTVVISALAASVQNLENNAVRSDVDQNAQSKTNALKINILKNTLQAWEIVGQVDVANTVSTIDFLNLGLYRSLRVTGSLWPTVLAELVMRFSRNNGVAWDSSVGDYRFQQLRAYGTVVQGQLQAPSTAGLTFGLVNTGPNNAADFDIAISDFNTAKLTGWRSLTHHIDEGPNYIMSVIGGKHLYLNPCNALRFAFTGAASVAGGYIRLEGLRG